MCKTRWTSCQLGESGAKTSPCVAIHLHPTAARIEHVVDVADDDTARVLAQVGTMGDEGINYIMGGIAHPTEGVTYSPRSEDINAVTHVLLTLIESGEVEAGDFPVLDLVLKPSGVDESVIAVIAVEARSSVAEIAARPRVLDEEGIRWISEVPIRRPSRSATASFTTRWADTKTIRHVRHR